jgi:hypothetical protein
MTAKAPLMCISRARTARPSHLSFMSWQWVCVCGAQSLLLSTQRRVLGDVIFKRSYSNCFRNHHVTVHYGDVTDDTPFTMPDV